MSLPTSRDAHVDAALTQFAVGYGQDLAKDFISSSASTLVRVNKQSDKYYTWNKGDWFRSEMALRAAGDPARVAGMRLSNTSYFAEVYALATKLPDHTKANADLDLEKAKIRYLMGQAHLKRDLVFATECFATGLWTSNTEQTGKSSNPSTNEFLQWNDASSTPLTDVWEQQEVVRASIGRYANVAIMGAPVFSQLAQHPDLLALHQYVQGGLVTADQIARALGVDKVLVGKAVRNSAVEGATASMADVFGKHMLLAYIAQGQSLDEPTAIAGFSWNEFDKVDATGAAVRSWYDNPTKSTFYEAEMAIDFAITANDAGVFFKDAVA